jgi:hypothetical protein
MLQVAGEFFEARLIELSFEDADDFLEISDISFRL